MGGRDCPHCGSAMRNIKNQWVCVADGPLTAVSPCPLRGVSMTDIDITQYEIALIDAEAE
jgi:hypothetical protein